MLNKFGGVAGGRIIEAVRVYDAIHSNSTAVRLAPPVAVENNSAPTLLAGNIGARYLETTSAARMRAEGAPVWRPAS